MRILILIRRRGIWPLFFTGRTSTLYPLNTSSNSVLESLIEALLGNGILVTITNTITRRKSTVNVFAEFLL